MSLDHAVACMVELTHETKSLDWRIAYILNERVMDMSL